MRSRLPKRPHAPARRAEYCKEAAMSRRLFCEISPFCYKLSVQKEILRRRCRNIFARVRFARRKSDARLPNIVKGHTSPVLRRLSGVDMQLQQNKAVNLALACRKIDGLLIAPGETFSFWHTVGAVTKRRGYLPGLVIAGRGRLTADIGGGLCQLANMLHWLVLNSPLQVTELHHHSDAIFPDERRRVPFGTGTSVLYNYVDYRFCNTTQQTVQLAVWVEDGVLCGELRSEAPFAHRYKLVEENHHFARENGQYYRISQVYRLVIRRDTQQTVAKELVLDNHSAVLYDEALIPKEEIRNE